MVAHTMVRPALLIAALLAVVPASADAHGRSWRASSGTHASHHGGGGHRASSGHASGARSHASHRKAYGVPRGANGKIKRDPEQRARFMRAHPCPSTGKTHGACPGYVVDHVRALKRGGGDDPSNMQWQTVREAKAKDRWE